MPARTLRAMREPIRSLASVHESWKEVERKYVCCVWLFIAVTVMQLITDVVLSVFLFSLLLELVAQVLQHPFMFCRIRFNPSLLTP